MSDLTPEGCAFFEKVKSYLTPEEFKHVEVAFKLARREHGSQRRRSGELFFTHPLTVACYLADYHLDAPALAAALLHDVAEDTKVSIKQLREQFGRDVAMLVDGVTKLKDVSAGVAKGRRLTKEELQDATLAKMLGFMTDDVRVVIIKLFDRLHNMRTIKAMSPQSQRRKAQETLDVYAPLANRLGIWKIKNELEAISLEVIKPKEYELIKNRREEILQEQQELYQMISGQTMECLLQANIDVRNVILAPENIYTVYQDLVESGASFRDIDRTVRLVVLVNDWAACYQALGHIHQMWKPVPDTFDDYIANPRDNLYRSLHTTVIHNNGQIVKIRIRTMDMDIVSDIGVLARWLYKGTEFWSRGIAERVDAFMDNIHENINMEPQNPTMGVKGVVEDVFRQQIHVYTPRGEQIELPQGATAIDFAYSIHTGLGDQCDSVYVHGTSYPLNKPLQSGDQVRIVKRLRGQPKRSWLDEDLGYITTNYARNHARKWFRRLPEKTAVSQGKDLLQKELAMLGLPDYDHEKIAGFFGSPTVSDLYYRLGRAELLPTVVATRVLDDTWTAGPARSLDNVVYGPDGESFIITHANGRDLRLCGTCRPRPGDDIIGFVRKDGGVTVHNTRCHTLNHTHLDARSLKLGWGKNEMRHARLMMVQVDVYDRPGLLFEITNLLQSENVNISYINTPPTERPNEIRLIIGLEVLRPRQLVRLLHQMQALVNVYSVCCLHHETANGTPPFYHPE